MFKKEENAEITTLILDKADFRTRRIIKDKEGYYKIIRGPILWENITIWIEYASKHQITWGKNW